ncbi:MAG: SpoIID/LytB domain-containing protein [Bacteroidales bacterium]
MRSFFVKSVLVLFGSIFVYTAYATDLSVRIFSDRSYAKMKMTTVLGNYKILDGQGQFIADLSTNESVIMEVNNQKINLYNDGKSMGSYSNISFDGEGLKAIFCLSPEPSKKGQERYYDDHLEVSVEAASLFLINVVDLENYVAGVVQSEVRGISDKPDFYKIQAIISRTYAMNNLKKHIQDGYNLCDDVHCQVYKSRNNMPIILTATVQTAGKVLVDSGNHIITASFYSNSGGETVNSEDVWNLETSYLKSIVDTFSLSMKNAKWQKIMPKMEWLRFLKKTYNYNIDNVMMRDSALSFSQETRKVYFCGQIPLKYIRRDLNLRSTFFSVTCDGETVILNGKGYGHGVGLSQEGAVKMVDFGYSVEDVIRFYYTGASIKDVDELPTDDLGD